MSLSCISFQEEQNPFYDFGKYDNQVTKKVSWKSPDKVVHIWDPETPTKRLQKLEENALATVNEMAKFKGNNY